MHTFWSLRDVTSCKKSATPLRSGQRKPSGSKKSSTCSRGPWYTCSNLAYQIGCVSVSMSLRSTRQAGDKAHPHSHHDAGMTRLMLDVRIYTYVPHCMHEYDYAAISQAFGLLWE